MWVGKSPKDGLLAGAYLRSFGYDASAEYKLKGWRISVRLEITSVVSKNRPASGAHPLLLVYF